MAFSRFWRFPGCGIILLAAAVSAAAQGPSITSIQNAAPLLRSTGNIARGELVSIYGSGLTTGVTLNAYPPNAPTTLAGTSVNIGGIAAPILYISPGQLNVQVPFEIPAGMASVNVTVTSGSQTSAPFLMTVAASDLGMFVAQGTSIAAPTSANTAVILAAPGNTIHIAATGLGSITPAVPSGVTPNPAAQPSNALATPAVAVNGAAAEVVSAVYSGLGLYLISAIVPPSADTGTVTVTLGAAGLIGPTGATGPAGATGPIGPAGPAGADGAAGPAGPAGASGPAGPAGSPGPAGVNGATGATGPVGPAGPTGPSTVNYTSNGSTANLLQTLAIVGSSSETQDATTSTLTGIVGIASATASAGSPLAVSAYGTAACVFDGPTTAGDYIQASASVAGNCHDAGPIYPASNQILGFVLSTNGSAGTNPVFLFGVEIRGGATGPTGATGAVGATGATGAIGATGAQGIQGAVGATGAQGIQGPQGIQGVPGVTGATGATGATGNPATAAGTWSAGGGTGPGGSYSAGDVVFYAPTQSSYISASSANNSTPPNAPWQLLSAQGPTGTTGATGAIGSTGAVGPAGATGAQGIQGITGPVGATGTTGATGATGAQGIQGFTGPQGPAGAQGATGPQGFQGNPGLSGSAGPIGATGATGATGSPLLAAGIWSAGGGSAPDHSYNSGDVVFDALTQSSYISASNENTSVPPNAPWQLLAGPGATGSTGATGATGATGDAGPQGIPGITGPQGPVGATGVGLTGAQGPAGPAGPTGATGLSAAGGGVYAGSFVNTGNVSPTVDFYPFFSSGSGGTNFSLGATILPSACTVKSMYVLGYNDGVLGTSADTVTFILYHNGSAVAAATASVTTNATAFQRFTSNVTNLSESISAGDTIAIGIKQTSSDPEVRGTFSVSCQ